MGERMKDKVVLVSGAGSALDGWGNGKAAAVLYAREGASVLLADISEYAVASTKQVIDGEGGASEVFIGDVTKAIECGRHLLEQLAGSEEFLRRTQHA